MSNKLDLIPLSSEVYDWYIFVCHLGMILVIGLKKDSLHMSSAEIHSLIVTFSNEL